MRRATAPQQTAFDLSTLFVSNANSICESTTAYGYSKLNGNAGYNESTYGLMVGGGEWAAEFSYGTVKGMARCSTVGSGYIQARTGTPTDDLNAEGAKYCWCQATGFDAEKDGTYQNVSSSSWFYQGTNTKTNTDPAVYCAADCANQCAKTVSVYNSFRMAVFGFVDPEQCQASGGGAD